MCVCVNKVSLNDDKLAYGKHKMWHTVNNRKTTRFVRLEKLQYPVASVFSSLIIDTDRLIVQRHLTERYLVQRRRPAPRRSNSRAEGMPRWPGSGTGTGAGRSSYGGAAAAGTSGFYTALLHCCNLCLGDRRLVQIFTGGTDVES